MKDDLPLVVVHLGTLPNHLKRNLEYLARNFPRKSLFLVTDQINYSSVKKFGFTVVTVEHLIDYWPTDFEIHDKRKYFRGNFWFSSKARLLLIPELMKRYNLSKVLHIESDVWIHPNFPFDFFSELTAHLAFPRMDQNRGIASILYINGSEGCRTLEKACVEWSSHTDMEILGLILKSSKDILELSSYEYEKDMGEDWIFDGAKLGMYLFGSDPRNSWGLIRRFNESPMGGLVDGDWLEFGREYLMISSKVRQKKIANLHIHAKNKAIFSDSWSLVLNNQIDKAKIGMCYGFSFYGFYYKFAENVRLGLRKVLRYFK
jgi:hypothetical protein